MVLTIRQLRANRLSGFIVLILVVMMLFVTKTAVEQYQQVRKYFRLQEYSSQVQDISDSLRNLEENAVALEDEIVPLKKLVYDTLKQFNKTKLTGG